MKVLVHFPKLSKYATGRIGRFKFMPEHGRHVLDGKLLTVEEFNAAQEQILGDDSLPHRPCVRLIPDEGETLSCGGPSVEEGKAMLAEIERLQNLCASRAEDLAVIVAELDRLRSENASLKQVVDAIGASANVTTETATVKPEPAEVDEPAEEAPKPDTAKKKKK